jgi:hypothetical protein
MDRKLKIKSSSWWNKGERNKKKTTMMRNASVEEEKKVASRNETSHLRGVVLRVELDDRDELMKNIMQRSTGLSTKSSRTEVHRMAT